MSKNFSIFGPKFGYPVSQIGQMWLTQETKLVKKGQIISKVV